MKDVKDEIISTLKDVNLRQGERLKKAIELLDELQHVFLDLNVKIYSSKIKQLLNDMGE